MRRRLYDEYPGWGDTSGQPERPELDVMMRSYRRRQQQGDPWHRRRQGARPVSGRPPTGDRLGRGRRPHPSNGLLSTSKDVEEGHVALRDWGDQLVRRCPGFESLGRRPVPRVGRGGTRCLSTGTPPGRPIRRRSGSDDGGFSFNPSGKDDDDDDRGSPLGVSENTGYRGSVPAPTRRSGERQRRRWAANRARWARPVPATTRTTSANPPTTPGRDRRSPKMMAAGLLSGTWRWGVGPEDAGGVAQRVGVRQHARRHRQDGAHRDGVGAAVRSWRPRFRRRGRRGRSGRRVGVRPRNRSGPPGRTRAVAPPLELQMPNRADVEKAFRTAIIDKLGVGMSQAEIAQMTDMYMWKVMQPQADAYRSQVENLEDEFYGRLPLQRGRHERGCDVTGDVRRSGSLAAATSPGWCDRDRRRFRSGVLRRVAHHAGGG